MLKTKEEIEQWLKKMRIKDYTINDDLTVDVEGLVDLKSKNLTEIPVQFNVVTGSFDCSINKLTSLKGSPIIVKKYFFCQRNKLTTLEGAPQSVDQFFADDNELISTKGIPSEIKGLCCLLTNPIKYVDHLPQSIGEQFYFDNRKGMLDGFEILYKKDDVDSNIKYLEITLEELRVLVLHRKLENTLSDDKTISNKPKGKI